MMPSVDRVGRCFPLTLAVALDGAPSLRACLTVHAPWFVQLEDLALSTLDDGFEFDGFDVALLAMDGAPAAAATPGAAPSPGWRNAPLPGGALADADLAGCSAWWGEGSELVAPCLSVCPSLPPAAGFAALLDGGWTERGWTA